MNYPIGVIIGLACVVSGMFLLNQPLAQFYDPVAMAVALGGTIAVATTVLPWDHSAEIMKVFASMLNPFRQGWTSLLRDCMGYIQASHSGTPFQPATKGLAGTILKEGRELIDLRFELDDIESILRERVDQAGERARLVADGFRSLAKYPPAFGLAGTVLGLVSLMRAITEGMETRETGMRMAIALVATLYGLMLANLIIAPLGESTLRRATIEKQRGLIALQAVLLAYERVSLLKAQEMLNSFVPTRKRVDYFKLGSVTEGESAAR